MAGYGVAAAVSSPSSGNGSNIFSSSPSNPAHATQIVCSGWVAKRGDWTSSFKNRFLRLTMTQLTSAQDEFSAPTMALPITASSVAVSVAENAYGYTNVFEVRSGSKKMVLRATSADQLDQWVAAINMCATADKSTCAVCSGPHTPCPSCEWGFCPDCNDFQSANPAERVCSQCFLAKQGARLTRHNLHLQPVLKKYGLRRLTEEELIADEEAATATATTADVPPTPEEIEAIKAKNREEAARQTSVFVTLEASQLHFTADVKSAVYVAVTRRDSGRCVRCTAPAHHNPASSWVGRSHSGSTLTIPGVSDGSPAPASRPARAPSAARDRAGSSTPSTGASYSTNTAPNSATGATARRQFITPPPGEILPTGPPMGPPIATIPEETRGDAVTGEGTETMPAATPSTGVVTTATMSDSVPAPTPDAASPTAENASTRPSTPPKAVEIPSARLATLSTPTGTNSPRPVPPAIRTTPTGTVPATLSSPSMLGRMIDARGGLTSPLASPAAPPPAAPAPAPTGSPARVPPKRWGTREGDSQFSYEDMEEDEDAYLADDGTSASGQEEYNEWVNHFSVCEVARTELVPRMAGDVLFENVLELKLDWDRPAEYGRADGQLAEASDAHYDFMVFSGELDNLKVPEENLLVGWACTTLDVLQSGITSFSAPLLRADDLETGQLRIDVVTPLPHCLPHNEALRTHTEAEAVHHPRHVTEQGGSSGSCVRKNYAFVKASKKKQDIYAKAAPHERADRVLVTEEMGESPMLFETVGALMPHYAKRALQHAASALQAYAGSCQAHTEDGGDRVQAGRVLTVPNFDAASVLLMCLGHLDDIASALAACDKHNLGGVGFKKSREKGNRAMTMFSTNLHQQCFAFPLGGSTRRPMSDAGSERQHSSGSGDSVSGAGTRALRRPKSDNPVFDPEDMAPEPLLKMNLRDSGTFHSPPHAGAINGASQEIPTPSAQYGGAVVSSLNGPVAVYDVLTVGAFAAHTHGFKQGGTAQQLLELNSHQQAPKAGKKGVDKERVIARRMTQSPAMKVAVEASAQPHSEATAGGHAHFEPVLMPPPPVVAVALRREIAFSQALSALVTAFSLTVTRLVSVQDDDDNIRGLTQLSEVGFLFAVESLLSTMGNELGMLGDMAVAVADLTAVSFRLNEKPPGPDGAVGVVQSSLSLMFHEVTGAYLITLDVRCRGLSPALAGGARIVVTPVLFTQGINANQTMANVVAYVQESLMLTRTTTLQEDVNMRSMERLTDFYRKYKAHRISAPEGWSPVECSALDAKFNALKTLVGSAPGGKNVALLIASEDFMRSIGGARVTCCKSAKDRTGMSVTLEQARMLTHHHTLRDNLLGAANVMRSRGTRRENAYKNVGRRTYAFNPMVRWFLPNEHQPPAGTSKTWKDDTQD